MAFTNNVITITTTINSLMSTSARAISKPKCRIPRCSWLPSEGSQRKRRRSQKDSLCRKIRMPRSRRKSKAFLIGRSAWSWKMKKAKRRTQLMKNLSRISLKSKTTSKTGPIAVPSRSTSKLRK
jgi:hypothetical protein